MSGTETGKTALEWLARSYPDSPKKRLKEWFANGRVQLDGQVITKSHTRMTDPGSRLTMGQPQTGARIFAKRMPLRLHAQVNLLYIDQSVAIVSKGAGILSVPLLDKDQISALKVLENYLKKDGQALGDRKRESRSTLTPLPVHRLDQYTSGLLCFAMNPKAREHLVKQVREHTFIREYLALGSGYLKEPRGTWRSWFELDHEGMHQSVYDEPKKGTTEAISSYEVVDSFSWATKGGNRETVSRLRLRLKTGLKHQLRIHASRAGVPLLGDRHYHPDYIKAAANDAGMPHGIKRQALHASSIGFVHPDTGKTKRFNSKFPRDLAEAEAHLRAKSRGET